MMAVGLWEIWNNFTRLQDRVTLSTKKVLVMVKQGNIQLHLYKYMKNKWGIMWETKKVNCWK